MISKHNPIVIFSFLFNLLHFSKNSFVPIS